MSTYNRYFDIDNYLFYFKVALNLRPNEMPFERISGSFCNPSRFYEQVAKGIVFWNKKLHENKRIFG